ncbi:2676_t:CDS:2 [Racocetra fulgida]|uniref:2676_t:CDS:1 n=1 Tax=Racocetra fulgida TaxID=60492 RepID=A0A9N9F9R3_9GLOM|nr:2676_t:CDS:2 [Racocetra fulgida]
MIKKKLKEALLQKCKNTKWGLRVDKSTISRILKTGEERLNSEIPNPDTKRHRAVTYPELDLALKEFDLALKEFVLIYQNRTILSDALLEWDSSTSSRRRS